MEGGQGLGSRLKGDFLLALGWLCSQAQIQKAGQKLGYSDSGHVSDGGCRCEQGAWVMLCDLEVELSSPSLGSEAPLVLALAQAQALRAGRQAGSQSPGPIQSIPPFPAAPCLFLATFGYKGY